MSRLYTNNFATTLDGGIDGSQTSIDVADATGLPSVGSGDTCQLTIDDGSNIEIVTCTAVSSDTLTVTRAQEGTSGTAFVDGTPIELRATALSFIDPSGEIDFGGADSLEIPNSAAPTVDADGEIAVDTTVADFSHGIIKYYSGEEVAVIAVPVAELTSPTDGYVIAYNAANDEFELVAQSTGSNSIVSARNNSFQSISATTWTKVTLDQELIDTNSDYDNATNYRFTPTVAGYYQISAAVALNFLGNSKYMEVAIYKNGTLCCGNRILGGGDIEACNVNSIQQCNGSTDYIELYVYHNDTAARNIYNTDGFTNFHAHKI